MARGWFGQNEKLAEGMAEAMGGTCEFEVLKGYPFLQNNPALTRRMKDAAIATWVRTR